MWQVGLWKKAFAEDEKKNLRVLCEVGDIVWRRKMLFEGKDGHGFEKDGESNNSSTA